VGAVWLLPRGNKCIRLRHLASETVGRSGRVVRVQQLLVSTGQWFGTGIGSREGMWALSFTLFIPYIWRLFPGSIKITHREIKN